MALTSVDFSAQIHIADIIELAGNVSGWGYSAEYLDYIRFSNLPEFDINQVSDTIVVVQSKNKDAYNERFNIAVVGTQETAGIKNIPQHDNSVVFLQKATYPIIDSNLYELLYQWNESLLRGYDVDPDKEYLYMRLIVTNGEYKYDTMKIGEPKVVFSPSIALSDILKHLKVYEEVPYIQLHEIENKKTLMDENFKINQKNDTIIIVLTPYRKYAGSENIHIYNSEQGMHIFPVKNENISAYNSLSFSFEKDSNLEDWDANPWVKYILKEWESDYIKLCAERTFNSAAGPGYEFTYVRIIVKDGEAKYNQIKTSKLIRPPMILIAPLHFQQLDCSN